MSSSWPARLLCLTFFVPSYCFPSAAGAAGRLPPIVISAARTAEPGIELPAATTIIDEQGIAESGARNLAELLRTVNVIHIADGVGGGGNSRIDMRGFGATAPSNVAVLINGRKINPATDTASLYLNSINLDNVAQIEIVQGSAGILYGNQAVGGLINIITRRPDSRSRLARVAIGSYNSHELTLGLDEPLGDGASLHVQLEQRESDNYRDHNASELKRFDGRIELAHQGGSSYVDLQLLDDYVETPGALFANELVADRRQAVFNNDYLDTQSAVLRVGLTYAISQRWRIEAEVALRDDEREFVQSFRGFPGTPSTQDRESVEFTPRLIGILGDSTVIIGIDSLSTDYRLLTVFGPQGNDQDIRAVYAQITQALTPQLSVTAGLRHARADNAIDNNGAPVQIDNDVTVGSLGFTWRPQPAWRLFARADQNYRFAKVDEHTNVPFGQPVGIDDQTGVSYEAGAEFTSNGMRFNANVYLLELKDEISFDAMTFTNVNLPRSRRRGLNMGIGADFAPGWSADLGYDYLDSEITSGVHTGSQVPLVPEHRASAALSYRPSADWLARLDIEYVDEQFLGADFDNRAKPLDAYTVINLVAHHDSGHWRISAKVNNLLDERYSETGASSFAGDGFNPAPERNFWLGVEYRAD